MKKGFSQGGYTNKKQEITGTALVVGAESHQIRDGFKKLVENYPTAEQVGQNLAQAMKDQSPYTQAFISQKAISETNSVRKFLKRLVGKI